MDFRYDEASQHESWVQFEVPYLHNYAHQMTEQLLSGNMTSQELQQWIAKPISDRYCFVDAHTDETTTFSDDLVGVSLGTKATA